jgi:uncharacterized protein
MFREALNQLNEWHSSSVRKPLLLRGARQVGKSWLVREFGKRFEHFVEINFEKQPEVAEFFAGNLDIPSLLEKLQIYTGKKITPENSLLFLDEVQECPRAITALRYFKEEYPELPVIAAGSLVDFALEKIGMPVGRVQFLYLHPLSFREFLLVQKRTDLCDYIAKKNIDDVIHGQLLEQVKTYFWLGGMPAVVDAWLTEKNPELCQQLQEEIISSYKQDFSRYKNPAKIEHLDRVFESIPKQLGKKFKYVNVDSDFRSAELKIALEALCKAGIAYKVYHSAAQGFPLSASQKDNYFKAFFFDIGLAQRVLRLDLRQWLLAKIEVQHVGAIAEQFVAQEYIAYTALTAPANLFYWHREQRTSNAEIDFIFTKQEKIIPVEVKSGTTGGLRSLQLFLQEHPNSPYGLQISEKNFSDDKIIASLPFYAIDTWLKNEDTL